MTDADWFQHVSTAVALMLCACFGCDPASAEAASRFVPAYIENDTTPQAPRNKNVVYYALSLMQNSGYDYIQHSTKEVSGQTKTTIKKTIPVNCLLTFYGSNADNDSEKFWSMFQWDSGAESPRAILRSKNIVPIGKPERPVSLFETEGTFHRRRCDVRLNLAYYEVTEHGSSAVTEPPEIEITQV
ncbi:MAG: hypothetical protein J6S78_05975 [Lachnospiraceae bacterium]|nr:hypothetical protein [Lachnospiraceae bacterium]